MAESLQIDVAIFGGGIAGLWTLDHLVRRGHQALLIETDRLGSGQTITSQGIIHGGLKYTLDGLLNRSAEAIRDMPRVWRDCFVGTREPDLSSMKLRAECCHLWRTGGLLSQIGMLGARVGLRVRPEKLPPAEWPAALQGLRGEAYRLPEQVLDPARLLHSLAATHRSRLLKLDLENGVDFAPANQCLLITLNSQTSRSLVIRANRIVLTAGAGNAALRRQLGLPNELMQRRPLHMVMVRGPMPVLNGHCTDAAATRVTITTAHDRAGQTVWQVGGQLAEDGVHMERAALIAHAQRELAATVPGVNLSDAQWSTYRVDRAEPLTADGRRPIDAWCRADGPVITAWPTKLALAPRLAEMVAALLPAASGQRAELPDWPRPEVAVPPWETEQQWSAAS